MTSDFLAWKSNTKCRYYNANTDDKYKYNIIINFLLHYITSFNSCAVRIEGLNIVGEATPTATAAVGFAACQLDSRDGTDAVEDTDELPIIAIDARKKNGELNVGRECATASECLYE